MHDHFHAFGLGVVTDFFQIEIRIWRHEIEDIVLQVTEPVFPALVPSFDKHGVEAVFRGEVNVFLHVFSGGAVMTVRLDLRIISHSELNRRQVPGIGPLRLAGNHLPPYTYIFDRSDPGSVLYLAWFIEIQRHTGSENVTCVVTDNDCAPRRVHRCLKIAFRTCRIRIEEGFENEILVIQIQMHAGIVHKGSFMNVHIESLVCLELKRGLHAGR